MEDVFSRIYQNNAWGDPESVSGPGSGVTRTAAFRDQIPKLLHDLRARSLLDAGCGDFNWLKELDLPLDYVGIDIVRELVAGNIRRYGSNSARFIHGDIMLADLPRVDVILCRDCLVHFSYQDARTTLRNFQRSQSCYLLTTTFVNVSANSNISTGGWRPLNLEREPFSFPIPLKVIDEQCLHTGGIFADKRLALWRLQDINSNSDGAS